MMNNINTYKKTKTNIAWMSELPEHWKLLKVKHLFEVTRGRVIPNEVLVENGKYPVYSSQTIDEGLMGFINTYDYDGEYISWTTDGVYAGTTFVRKGKFNATNICGLLKLKEFQCIEYLGYLFHYIIPYNKRPDTNGAKIMSNEMKNIFFCLPPINEQEKIANYLDSQTKKINHFITKKQQFIELLKEQRQSVINEAVTKGLNKNVKLKDSGIKWLDSIPEHWEVRKIFYSFDLIGSGTTPESGNEKYYLNGEYYWINSGDLNDSIVVNTEKKITQLAIEKHSILKLYNENSLIIAMYGATIGKTGLTKVIGCTNQACCVLSNSKVFNIEFVQYWFIGNRHILLSMSYGGGQPNISQEVIKQLRITCPPLHEQTQIVNHIKSETSTIDAAISKTEREIELIKEYKEAMIAEAVMGKINLNKNK